MSRKGEKEKKFLIESFPAIKTQFELKLREEERIEYKANVLLVIAGVFGLLFYSIDILSISDWGFIPFIPLFCVYGLSLFNMATVGSVTPWVGKQKFEEFQNNYESSKVNKNIINTMYRLTGQIDNILTKKERLVWEIIYLLPLSFIWLFIVYFLSDKPILMFILIMLFSYAFAIAVYHYWHYRLTILYERLQNLNR